MPQIIDERRMGFGGRVSQTEVTFFFVQESGGGLKLLARFFTKLADKCIVRWLELSFPEELLPKVYEALKSEKFAKLLSRIDGEHVDLVVRDRGVGFALTDSGKLYLILRDTPFYLSTTKELDAKAFTWVNGALLRES